MPTTTGMKGDGFYNAHSDEQRAAIDAFLPWLKRAVADLPLDSHQSIQLLDIGSAEGGNAIYVMNELIAELRRRTELPISVCFSDLPTNDFNSLFRKLFPGKETPVFGSEVYPGAVAGSGFHRLCAAGALIVATTFNAIGFLDRKPAGATLPHFILPMPPGTRRAAASVSDAEQAPFREQAAADLRDFYSSRAAELVSGGKLLVQVFGRNEMVSTSDGIYDVLSDALLGLVRAGTLTRRFYEDLTFPIYFRSLDELTAPLESDAEIARAFRIENADSVEIAAPFNVEFQESGDVSAWAGRYTNFLRAFTEPIIFAALPGNCPKTEILDDLYRAVEKLLAADPGSYPFHYISLGVLLTRV